MKKINLLVVEDEIAIRDMLRFSLPQSEFVLADAEDVDSAKRLLARRRPDLILLDWMLPGQSGIGFIRWLRNQQEFQDIPVILLTAKAEEENKVKGLLSGADDYITKPFSPLELIARIKTVLRRGTLILPDNEIRIGKMVLNYNRQELLIEEKLVNLSPIEFKILDFFMRNPGKTYNRDQLISRIWGVNVYIDERTVDVQIRRLRLKLKQYNHEMMIKTIRGRGYQFSLDYE